MQSLPDAGCLQAAVEVAHCDYNQREVWDFHILQTESRRLDLSAVFMGLPGAKSIQRLPCWGSACVPGILSPFSHSIPPHGRETEPCSQVPRVSEASLLLLLHLLLLLLFLHLSVWKSLVIKFLSSRYMRPVHLSVTVSVHGSTEPSNASKFYNTVSVWENVTRHPTIITLL